jgi:hypothetical protein
MTSFDYKFEYDNDEVYFSYCVPYTYSRLLKYIKEKTSQIKMKESNNVI